MATEAQPTLARRQFLRKLSLGLVGLASVVVAIPIVGFLLGPLLSRIPDAWRTVGAVDEFPIGSTIKVSFLDPSPLAWAGVTAQTAAWLRRDAADKFTAFAVNCSHMGCPVQWLPNADLFMCPCHGGVYYRDGRVAAGPPPRPLSKYQVRIRDSQVEIRAAGVPIG